MHALLALHELTARGLDSIRILIVLIVIFVVAFWKLLLQVLIIVTAAIVLIGAVSMLSLLSGALHI
jgi:hypothetical protein